jgi:DNA-binding winged helix-turn-helix (wHTH) protein
MQSDRLLISGGDLSSLDSGKMVSAFVAHGRRYIVDDYEGCLYLQGRTEPIHLPKTAWKMLHYFVGVAGKLVTEDELLRAIWGQEVIGPTSLSKTIGIIRRALGDSQASPEFIQTVHGRGYRFVAAVEKVASDRGARDASVGSFADSGVNPVTQSPRSVADQSSSRTHVGKLPFVDPTVIGRDQEFDVLEMAWTNPATNFIQVFAPPGTGKTALVDKWFRRHTDPSVPTLMRQFSRS